MTQYYHNSLNNEKNLYQLKHIIIPKGIKIPNEDPEYKIPYTVEELKNKRIDIFPPV